MQGFALRAMAVAVACLTAACSQQALECVQPDCVIDQKYKDTTIDSVMMFPNAYGWDVRNPRFEPPPPHARGIVFEKAYLEVNQDGVLWDVKQTDAILAKIDALSKEKRPVFVFAFAHGWHHNADTHDRAPTPANPHYKIVTDEPSGLGFNALKFDYLMARFGDQVRRQFELNGDDNTPAMLGIYIGWRGKSTYGFVTNAVNVGNRSQTADKIGLRTGQGSLREALGAISEKVAGTGERSRMIVSGHSLGGRLMSQMFLSEIAGGTPYPLGEKTLIVAIEPAIAAACYDGVFGAKAPKTNHGMAPSFIAITSGQDDAVVQGFRWGFLLPTLNPGTCADTGAARRSAIGVYAPYVTHRWTFSEGKDIRLPKQFCKPPALSPRPDWLAAGVTSQWEFPYFDRNSRCPNAGGNYSDEARAYTLTSNPGDASKLAGPVWNIETDVSLIDTAEDKNKSRLSSIDPHHNGFVSTGLADILSHVVYARAKWPAPNP